MDYKDLICTSTNSNCFEKTEAGGAFFIFHQITDELSTKHEPRLRTTVSIKRRFNVFYTLLAAVFFLFDYQHYTK
jgi:hypothetical protein